MAKLETGKVRLTPFPFSLSSALKGLIRMTSLQAQKKGLDFLYEMDDTLPDGIRGDKKRLRQVLFNLLGNAIKFTKQGQVTLRVKKLETRNLNLETPQAQSPSSHDTYPVSSIQFQVEDTGIGIPQERITHIFEPFEQLNDQHIFVDGPGLGLSISQRLLHMMDSELHVESRENEGSRFWFELKLPQANTADYAVIPEDDEVYEDEKILENDVYTTPSREILLKLEELAAIGDISGIRQELDRLTEQEPLCTPFVDTLRPFVDAMEIIAIQQYITRCLDENPT
jgi:hypothetical protein